MSTRVPAIVTTTYRYKNRIISDTVAVISAADPPPPTTTAPSLRRAWDGWRGR